MLDDRNVLRQRDPSGVLEHASRIAGTARWQPEITDGEYEARELQYVVFAGMGGSALASDIAAHLLGPEISVSFDVVRGYELPAYARENTLVIVDSHSGNTEETLSCYGQARERNCQIAVLSTGGQLLETAHRDSVVSVTIPSGGQPRMATIMHLRAIFALLEHFGVITSHYSQDIEHAADWLEEQASTWHSEVPTHANYAKQFALLMAGKTPVFYGGERTAPLAYKLKISWNENAKNVAFHNEYPEFNHNEFIGWSSHPIEKPFAIVDLISDQERDRITERMRLSDRLLSGKRPKSTELHLAGDSLLQQMLWTCIFADYASIYAAMLNHVDPEPVELVEKLKKELS